ncbi:MAG TPA: SagB family peptide dehydrogenase [Myxococcaceae bacterium]|jgi:SagB-type dehydrogenase family enzyme
MTPRETLFLVPGVSMALLPDGRREVAARVRFTLPPVSPGVGAALEALSQGGHSAEELHLLAHRDGTAAAAMLQLLLKILGTHGVLSRTLHLEGVPLATLSPAPPRLEGGSPNASARSGLSRFAFTRASGGGTLLETPVTARRVFMPTWHGPALLGALAAHPSSEAFASAVPGIPPEVARAFLRLLMEAGAVTELGPEGAPVEPEALATWEFHDLLLHGRSRREQHEAGYGATYRFRGRLPEPGKKPPMQGEVLPLEVPDLTEVARRDPPFTSVVEGRRSLRTHGSPAVTRAQLSELLYRAVGARRAPLRGQEESEARAYPAGGGLYELEVYAVLHQCEGLEPGLYHYQPEPHALTRVSGRTGAVDQLLGMAASGASLPAPPQVLLVLTARFARVAWKYEAMAYSLMLKHVGVVFQNLYLVATAMDLAPCALGGSSAEVFAHASGLSPLVEGAVGEFLLGTRVRG